MPNKAQRNRNEERRHLIDVFVTTQKDVEPDVYVECGAGLAQKAGIENDEHGFLHPRVIQLDAFFNEKGML